MSDEISDPRLQLGANMPPLAESISAFEGDFASLTTEFLDGKHGKHAAAVAALLEEARGLPNPIDDDATKAKYTGVIKRLRDQAKIIDGIHGAEKQPYLRGGQAVDQFCFGLIDKLARRDKKAKAGAADVLLARLTDYDNRKLAEEQARRAREAEAALAAARQAQAEAAEQARKAEEARQAAERARAPTKIAEKAVVAEQAEQAADAAKVEAVVVTEQARAAHVATLATAADIMRTRGDDGTLSTMAKEPFAEIVDRDLLDKAQLWPFIPLDALQKALNAWAKIHDHNRQMPGANIGRRNKSVVR